MTSLDATEPREQRPDARRPRPPVQVSTIVHASIDRTFDVFVHGISAWWPVTHFSAGRESTRSVTVEAAHGGRVFETWDDGTVVEWGEIRTWDPPRRFEMTWRSTPSPTEVGLRFQSLGPSLTRVTVEHRGWEALTEAQLAEDCALPGGYSGGAYGAGWKTVLERFAAAAENPESTTIPEPPTVAEPVFRRHP